MRTKTRAYLYYGVDICTVRPFDEYQNWLEKPKDMSQDSWLNFSAFARCKELEKYLETKELCSGVKVGLHGCLEDLIVFLYTNLITASLKVESKLITTRGSLELVARHCTELRAALKILNAPKEAHEQVGWHLTAHHVG